ncbi:MAG TPA: substrate-binding domain-containing protein [Opitutales bacterium]|nr:substrate-binding domain-containing protein [Opitutales bacterium]
MPLEILSPSVQVAAHLYDELFSGTWKDQLPGTPAIADELGVDRKTVTAALQILEDEGLLQSQGLGRKRKILLPEKEIHNGQTVKILLYERADGLSPHILELIRRVEKRGHHIKTAKKTLRDLGMDVKRVSSFVKRNPADAWIVLAGSKEVLSWFAEQGMPAFAIFGRRQDLPIASVGPEKVTALQQAVGRLVELGHRQITLLSREERRRPSPGHLETVFLECLDTHGIEPSAYHLPDWQDNRESFHDCLDLLFREKPPTAILLDQPQFFIAAQQHLANKGLVAPRDVSLLCSDTHPLFDWCQPEITHISWEVGPIVDHAANWVTQVSKGKNPKRHKFTEACFVEGGTIGPVPRG